MWRMWRGRKDDRERGMWVWDAWKLEGERIHGRGGEKWYGKESEGATNILAFDKIDKTWRNVSSGAKVGDDETYRNYKEIPRPY